ncbi:hypothetical protein GLE_1706 [Lysobacter enzymogenes]|uniref:Uncharacterized protein n=1 Tax=Lysobacter enzymogenes TaxID=69 RepID=A0A0S2DER8_LYSEN|nr:hypothetical protein GLE_1706 [Lysobacter enzymogenes]
MRRAGVAAARTRTGGAGAVGGAGTDRTPAASRRASSHPPPGLAGPGGQGDP